MRLECGWRHVRMRWSWEFEDFEKESVECWCLTMEVDSWVPAIEDRVEFWPLKGVVGIFGSLPTVIFNTTRSTAHWWSQYCKNCVSLLVLLWVEVKKLINRSYNRVRLFSYLYHCYHWHHQIMATNYIQHI